MNRDLDLRMPLRKPTGDLSAAIGRGVVDDEDAQLVDTLREYAFHGVREEMSVVVAGNGNIDAGHGNRSTLRRCYALKRGRPHPPWTSVAGSVSQRRPMCIGWPVS